MIKKMTKKSPENRFPEKKWMEKTIKLIQIMWIVFISMSRKF